MFKVTEYIVSDQGRTNINYLTDGEEASVMVSVGQILNHRKDTAPWAPTVDSIIIRQNGYDVDRSNIVTMYAGRSAIAGSDLEIMEAVMGFLRAIEDAKAKFLVHPNRQMVIQF